MYDYDRRAAVAPQRRPVRPVKTFTHWAKEDVRKYRVPVAAQREILRLAKELDTLEARRQKLGADDEFSIQHQMTQEWEKLKALYVEHIGFDPPYPGFW